MYVRNGKKRLHVGLSHHSHSTPVAENRRAAPLPSESAAPDALASRDRAEFRVSPVYSLRPKSWRAHALREMVHRQRHPIMLLLDHRIQRLEHRADNDFRDRLHFPVTMESRSYYISRFGAAPADFSGIWAIIQSIVSINPAIEAAFCRAVRVTLQGSRIPNSTMSPY